MKAFCIFGKMFSWLTHYCPHSLITSLKQFYSHDLAMPQKKLRHLRRLHDKFWGTLGSLEKLWAQFFLRSGVGIIQLFLFSCLSNPKMTSQQQQYDIIFIFLSNFDIHQKMRRSSHWSIKAKHDKNLIQVWLAIVWIYLRSGATMLGNLMKQ